MEGRFGERVETIDQKVELPSGRAATKKEKTGFTTKARRTEGFESFNFKLRALRDLRG
jgi:hypothetical protein